MQNNSSAFWSVGGIDARTGFKPANDDQATDTNIPHQEEKPSKAEQKQNAIDAYAEKTYFEILKDIECLQSGTDRTKTLYAKASKLFQAQAAGQLVGFDIGREVTDAALKSGLKPSEIKSTLAQVEKISSTAQAIIPSGSTYTPDPVKQAEVKAKATEQAAKQEASDKVQRESWVARYNSSQLITDTFKPSQYLINKGIFNEMAVSLCRQNSYTDKQGKLIEQIIRPMLDYQTGEMVGVERIVFTDENKWGKFRSKGCTGTTVGTIVQGDNKKVAYVVEGLADALTINQALNATVYTTYKGCIPAMIEWFSLSGQEFILCLDNDKDVQSIIDKLPDGTKYILPVGDGIKDINDVLVKLGADAVIKQLSLPVKKSPQEPKPEFDPVKFFDLIDGTTMAAQAKAPNYLIEYMLEDNAHGFLAGSSGAFKSFIALEMGHCIASGRPFLGNKVMKKGKVIYICGEGKGGIKRRLRAIDNKYGESSNIMIINRDIALNEKGMIDALSSLFSKVEPVLVIYDTLNSLSGGIENNSSGDTSALYKALASASNVCGASTMIVHHYGKDKTKGMEGSHTFRSNADYVFTADRSDDKLLVTRLGNMKQKDGEEFQPILIELEEVGLGFNDHNDKPCHSLRVVGKAPDNLVMRASPEKITAKSETLRAIKCLHAEQAKATGNLKVIVSPKDIKNWMECHSEKKYNQKYIGELENNGDIIQKGNGYIPK